MIFRTGASSRSMEMVNGLTYGGKHESWKLTVLWSGSFQLVIHFCS